MGHQPVQYATNATDHTRTAYYHYPAFESQNLDTVILYGSLGSTVSMWEPNLEALRSHYNVIAMDARGHGESEVVPGPYTIDQLVDDVLGVAKAAALNSFNFVGLSLGGMAGIRLAAKHPGLVDKLVLLCTSVDLPSRDWLERANKVRSEGLDHLAGGVASRWYSHKTARENPARIESARQKILATSAEAYASCCEAIASMDLKPDLALITSSTLVIAGSDDLATPPSHLEGISNGIAGSSFMLVKDAGHLASSEQPEIINEAILEHFSC